MLIAGAPAMAADIALRCDGIVDVRNGRVVPLTRAGKPYDLVVLPEQTHRLEGQSREYVLDAVRR